jgi:hypothetical protein
MPLKKAKSKSELQSAISSNIRELMADNKKKGKAKGAGGKARSKKQILAISIAAAKGK